MSYFRKYLWHSLYQLVRQILRSRGHTEWSAKHFKENSKVCYQKCSYYRVPAQVAVAWRSCHKNCLSSDKGGVRRRWPEWAKWSNRSGSEKPVQDSERCSSLMRFGSDPQITIPASGFLKTPHSKALQKTALDHSHSWIKNFLHYGRQPQKSWP